MLFPDNVAPSDPLSAGAAVGALGDGDVGGLRSAYLKQLEGYNEWYGETKWPNKKSNQD